MPDTIHFVSHLNGQIRYRDSGKGSCVVFLHGFLERLEIWNSFHKLLSSRYRVISIDLPGHGETSNFGYVHSMEDMAKAVHAVLHSLKIRRCFIVGHSMGGYTALAFGEIFPDKVKGICLFHSTASADSPQKKKDRNRTIQLVKKNYAVFIREAIPNLFFTAKNARKTSISKIMSMAKKTSLQGVIAALEGMKIRADREVMLKFSPFPIHFIIGRHDAVLNMDDLVKQSELNPDSACIVLNNTGHMGFLEEPARTKAFIEKILKLK